MTPEQAPQPTHSHAPDQQARAVAALRAAAHQAKGAERDAAWARYQAAVKALTGRSAPRS